MFSRSHPARVFAALLLCLFGETAWAQTPPPAAGRDVIALMSLELAGTDSAPLRDTVAGAIADAIRSRGRGFVELADVTRATSADADLTGCLTVGCIARLTQATGSTQLARVHISATGNSYEIDIEILSATAEGGLAGRLQETCSVCTVVGAWRASRTSSWSTRRSCRWRGTSWRRAGRSARCG